MRGIELLQYLILAFDSSCGFVVYMFPVLSLLCESFYLFSSLISHTPVIPISLLCTLLLIHSSAKAVFMTK